MYSLFLSTKIQSFRQLIIIGLYISKNNYINAEYNKHIVLDNFYMYIKVYTFTYSFKIKINCYVKKAFVIHYSLKIFFQNKIPFACYLQVSSIVGMQASLKVPSMKRIIRLVFPTPKTQNYLNLKPLKRDSTLEE